MNIGGGGKGGTAFPLSEGRKIGFFKLCAKGPGKKGDKERKKREIPSYHQEGRGGIFWEVREGKRTGPYHGHKKRGSYQCIFRKKKPKKKKRRFHQPSPGKQGGKRPYFLTERGESGVGSEANFLLLCKLGKVVAVLAIGEGQGRGGGVRSTINRFGLQKGKGGEGIYFLPVKSSSKWEEGGKGGNIRVFRAPWKERKKGGRKYFPKPRGEAQGYRKKKVPMLNDG